MTAASQTIEPFPGLRPFRPEEAPLFFGRDEEIEKLLVRLSERRFLAVVGTSGSGKSSLVRAGLIPTIQRGHLGPTGSRWAIATVERPGLDPLHGLARALQQAFHLNDEPDALESTLTRSNSGLADFGLAHLAPGQRLLIFVDQFEELFRYRRQTGEEGRIRSTKFVKLLLAATGHSDLVPPRGQPPIYVVLTMRSDYLGKCAEFRGLPEALNDSQYLVPRMGRDQLRETIEGPLALAGAGISDQLVDRLLNDTGDNPDLLPVMQHVLLRIWEVSSEARAVGSPIDLSHYEDECVQGMEHALNLDAEAAYAKLNGDRHKRAARTIFQRLVEPGESEEESRRPTKLSELVHLCGLEAPEVREVLEVFSARGFVTFSADDDPVVDIPHEALIRQWERLKRWVSEDPVYRRLAYAAANNRPLFRGLDLAEALYWEKTESSYSEWATRYGGDEVLYKQAMKFLRRSQRWHRIRQITVALFVAYLAGIALVFYLLYHRATQQKRIADSLRSVSTAQLYRNTRPDLSMLLSVEAYKANDTFEARNALLTELEMSPGLLAFLYHQANVWGVAFSPNGKTLASASADNTVWLWDVASRQPLGKPLEGHTDIVTSIAFSPDGKRLASASEDKTVRLWDLATRQQSGKPLEGHTDFVWSVAFSPDGKMLASASEDKTVRLWDVATRQQSGKPLEGHTASVYSVAFSQDGKMLASASEDKTVRLWDVATRQQSGKPLEGHTDSVQSVAFSPDGKMLASASEDKTVRLWDVATRQQSGKPLEGHTDSVQSVAFSPDGKTLASASADRTVRLWDVATREQLGKPLEGHTDFVWSVAFSPDGRTLASASADETVRLWDVAIRQPLGKPLEGHTNFVWSVAFSPDGKTLASASADKTVRLWDVAIRQPLGKPLEGHTNYVDSVAFSPDGKTLASASGDKTVRLWDVAIRQPLGKPLEGHTNYVNSVAFSPDGKMLASASFDKTVWLWDVASRQKLGKPLEGHTASVYSVAFSPDGKTLASASEDKTVRLWDAASRQNLGTLFGHTASVYSVAFSPDGKTLASASLDTTVRLWDVGTRQQLGKPLEGHKNSVYSVAFSPDGKTLASGGDDNTVRLWDVATRQPLGKPLEGHSDSVYSVAFGPDGKLLASASRDKTVRLWDVDPESWVLRTCSIVNRNLTPDEWAQFIGRDVPYRKTCPTLPIPDLTAR